LALNFYDQDIRPDHQTGANYYFAFNKTNKFQAISLVCTHFPQLLNEYEFIWLVDEDIELDVLQVNSYFKQLMEKRYAISQPAVTGFAHFSSLKPNGFFDRHVVYVETMMPCFRKDIFVQHVLPFMREENAYVKSAWGYDEWWSSLPHAKVLVQSIQAKHLEAQNFNQGVYKALGVDRQAAGKEMDYLRKKYNLTLKQHYKYK